jgi:RNA polymerase sigma-70 factor (ECF subfamily)
MLRGMKDALIIEGLRKKDKVIFDYVFNYYYSSLCAFASQYVDEKNAVEDLVQDFFLSFWMDAPNLQITHSLKTYFFTSIKNRCLDYQKHAQVKDKYKSYVLFAEKDEDNTFDHFLAESELRQIIERSLSKLPPRCREIFVLSRFKGYSNQEISNALGISKRTVELQISNSLKVLRKELADYLPLCIIAWIVG